MGKLIDNGYVNLDEVISSPISIITGANLRKGSKTSSPKPKAGKRQQSHQDKAPDSSSGLVVPQLPKK